MKLAEALTARAAFVTFKKKLSDAGIDTSDITAITQLPDVLANMVPDGLAEKAAAILEDEEALDALITAFGSLANSGALMHLFDMSNDTVREEDLTCGTM